MNSINNGFIDYIICAYATKSHLHFSDRLEQTLKCLLIDNYYIEKYDHDFNYPFGYLYKPQFIKNCLNRFNNNIFFVDVDSLFLKTPQIPNKKFDIGLILHENEKSNFTYHDYAHLWINNKKTVEFLNMWIEYTNESRKKDHILLEETIKNFDNFEKIIINDYLIDTIISYTNKSLRIRHVHPEKIITKSQRFKNKKLARMGYKKNTKKKDTKDIGGLRPKTENKQQPKKKRLIYHELDTYRNRIKRGE